MTYPTKFEKWREIVIKEEAQLKLALEIVGKVGSQIALIIRKNGQLSGIITDSDIRKALLKGISLEEKVSAAMNKNPFVVSDELGHDQVTQIMRLNHIFHLPIVDNNGIIIGLHIAEQLQSIENKQESLVIMAGGKGRRLMPLTAETPKPMLPINGRPILEHIITKAISEGFKNITISVNYLANIIKDHFGDGSKYGINIDYIQESTPLGTAGSLGLLLKKVKTERILVTNADIISSISYSDFLHESKRTDADGLMAIRIQEWQNPYGVILSEGNKMIGIREKPTYSHKVNAGIYVVNQKLIRLLRTDEYCDMTSLFERGINMNMNMRLYPLHENWIDIGRPSDYDIANDKSSS